MQTDDIASPNLDALRAKLLRDLQAAYAMETQVEQTLGGYADDMREAPFVHERLVEHLVETQRHRERLEQRLDAYGSHPSAIKDALGGLAGHIAAATSGLRPDAVARDAQDVYVAEHAEIAVYAALITTARAYGDGETVRVCEANLRDEVRMARWLEEHLPDALLLAYERDGIIVPGPVAEEAVATWRAAWQGASWAAQTAIPPGASSAVTSPAITSPAITSPAITSMPAAPGAMPLPNEPSLVPPAEQPTTQESQP